MLLQPILFFVGKATAQAVDDHKNYGRRKDTPYDDKQKFHAPNLKGLQGIATPASLSRRKSAEMATIGSIPGGIFAHIPFWGGAAMLSVSHKEDALWMNSATPKQTLLAAVGSVSSWPLLSSYLSCFMRFLQGAGRRQPLIRQHLAQPTKAPLCLKKQHLHNRSPQLWANKTNTTHTTTTKGGRSHAFAFAALMTVPRTVAVRAHHQTHTLMTKGSPC